MSLELSLQELREANPVPKPALLTDESVDLRHLLAISKQRSTELHTDDLTMTERTPLPSRRPWMIALAAAATIMLIGASLLLANLGGSPDVIDETPIPAPTPSTAPPAAPDLLGDGWIAFSTQPGSVQVESTDYKAGGDIYLVREGVEPILIVSRGDSMTTNICPAFSTDGSKLAYGHKFESDRAVVILAVAADGSVSEITRLELPEESSADPWRSRVQPPAPCPRWTSDGVSIAYEQDGSVVVRGLDGSTRPAGDGDPTLGELQVWVSPEALLQEQPELEVLRDREFGPLPSPDGEWIVDGEFRLARRDGSDMRRLGNAYAVPTWSPDSRYLLTMQDVGDGFKMVMRPIEEPFESVVLVPFMSVNGARSWPGRGDVSWQPLDQD